MPILTAIPAKAQTLDEFPLDRNSAQLAYDSGSDRIIMFGGWKERFSDPAYGDTWAYSFNTNSWVNMSPSSAPSKRSASALAYDADSDVTILFSGHKCGEGETLESWQETWAYHYDSNTWIQQSPSQQPPPRIAAPMVYDSQSDVMVLFGGLMDGGEFSNETWVYDCDADSWTRMNPPIHPSSRVAAMSYDSKYDRVVLFGGGGYDEWPIQTYTDTWVYDYDNNSWTEMKPAEHPVSIGVMVYDVESEVCVFFGGAMDWFEGELEAETWIFDYGTNAWTEMSPNNHPQARARAYMAYDTESDRTVLYSGGWYNDTESYYIINDLWAYDTNTDTWEKRGPPMPIDPLVIAGGIAMIALVVLVFVRWKTELQIID